MLQHALKLQHARMICLRLYGVEQLSNGMIAFLTAVEVPDYDHSKVTSSTESHGCTGPMIRTSFMMRCSKCVLEPNQPAHTELLLHGTSSGARPETRNLFITSDECITKQSSALFSSMTLHASIYVTRRPCLHHCCHSSMQSYLGFQFASSRMVTQTPLSSQTVLLSPQTMLTYCRNIPAMPSDSKLAPALFFVL